MTRQSHWLESFQVYIVRVGIVCQETSSLQVEKGLVIVDPFQDGRNMKVAVAPVLRMTM